MNTFYIRVHVLQIPSPNLAIHFYRRERSKSESCLQTRQTWDERAQNEREARARKKKKKGRMSKSRMEDA